MTPDQLLTDAPTTREVQESLARLPPPPAEALEALSRLLRSTEVPSASGPSAAWPPLLQHAHSKHDARYAEPATSHRPLVGPPLVLAKRAFRALFQPFINEVLRRQVEFNEAILEALARMHELQQEALRSEGLWRRQVEAQLAELRAALEATRTSPPEARPGETDSPARGE